MFFFPPSILFYSEKNRLFPSPGSDTTTPENGLFLLAFFQKNEKIRLKSTANGSFFFAGNPAYPVETTGINDHLLFDLPKWQVEQPSPNQM